MRHFWSVAASISLAGNVAAQPPTSTSPAGTGRYPAEMVVDESLPQHTIYRPITLSGKGKLPIIIWGNGGCRGNGARYSAFAREIASHGYLMIANGDPIAEAPQTVELPEPASRLPKPRPNPSPESWGRTTAAQMSEAIDWAIKENARPASPYFRKLDTDAIAAMGHSCGGLQALWVSQDRRIRTTVIHNSGVYENDDSPTVEVPVRKALLKSLHAPIIYIIGGPTDIAYGPAHDDFDHIDHLPVVLANIDVGHSGTFTNANGGKVAPVTIAWLNWQLKGNLVEAKLFKGRNCGLCTSASWRIERKGIN